MAGSKNDECSTEVALLDPFACTVSHVVAFQHQFIMHSTLFDYTGVKSGFIPATNSPQIVARINCSKSVEGEVWRVCGSDAASGLGAEAISAPARPPPAWRRRASRGAQGARVHTAPKALAVQRWVEEGAPQVRAGAFGAADVTQGPRQTRTLCSTMRVRRCRAAEVRAGATCALGLSCSTRTGATPRSSGTR